jgi:phage-related protein
LASVGEISVKLTTDNSGLTKGLNSAVSSIAGFSKQMVSGLTKVAAVGVAAVAAGVTAIATSSIKAYADYEQLVGGVETLFKDSSDIIQGYAENAYKTAGMSANEYMETVTGFSARLLQGLGGDTEAAAAYANTAITDMSDNANKMGTDVSLIQNAYQGFAKQNYSMLDNLKLGYGGTAAEMARLVNDSGVLGDAVTVTADTLNDVSFDQLISAIHEVQTDIGITGTTAKEANTTLQGSFKSMSSAWENLLVGFADPSQDIDKLLSNMIDTVVTFADNLVPRITAVLPRIASGVVGLITGLIPYIVPTLQELVPVLIKGVIDIFNSLVSIAPDLVNIAVDLIDSLIQGLLEGLPELAESAVEIITTLAMALLDMLPDIVELGLQLIIALALGIAESLPTLIPKVVDTILLIVDTLLDNIDLIIQAAIALIVGLATGLIEALPMLIEKAPDIIIAICNALVENLPLLAEAAIQIIIALAGALIESLPKLVMRIPEIITAIVNALGAGLSAITDVGAGLVEALWNGIKSLGTWIGDKVTGFFGGVVSDIKDFLGIHSPSTVFRGIGKNMALGVGGGFASAMQGVSSLINSSVPTELGLSTYVYGSGGVEKSTVNHTGTIRVVGVTDRNEFVGIADLIAADIKEGSTRYVSKPGIAKMLK